MSEWEEVDYVDAAVAHRGGRHEIQRYSDFHGGWLDDASRFFAIDEKYRIREKRFMLTVTIPVPMIGMKLVEPHELLLSFRDAEERSRALETICKASRDQVFA